MELLFSTFHKESSSCLFISTRDSVGLFAYDENVILFSSILFSLLEPPERPVILNARGRGGQTKLIEPYNEGTDVTLICEVTGGEFN